LDLIVLLSGESRRGCPSGEPFHLIFPGQVSSEDSAAAGLNRERTRLHQGKLVSPIHKIRYFFHPLHLLCFFHLIAYPTTATLLYSKPSLL